MAPATEKRPKPWNYGQTKSAKSPNFEDKHFVDMKNKVVYISHIGCSFRSVIGAAGGAAWTAKESGPISFRVIIRNGPLIGSIVLKNEDRTIPRPCKESLEQ